MAEKRDPAERVAGAREDVQTDSRESGAKATEQRAAATEKAETPNPDSPADTGPHYHAPSQPDQASEADKDAADNAPFRGVEGDHADNEIESTVRRMAGEGATSGEIAAYRADALAKLGD